VHRFHEEWGVGAPASLLAQRLGVTKQRVQAYFRRLNDLGWLRSAASPAIPARKNPLTIQQLGRRTRSGHASSVSTAAPQRVVEIPPLDIRAQIVPKTANEELRTVDLVWTTGAPVERYDWVTGKRYIEQLSLDPKSIRLTRLNAGGPLLNSHNDYDLEDQIGAVVQDSVSLTKSEGRARVRFSRRPSVEPIWQDVKDGIIRSVSVGYRVYRYEEAEGDGNKIPVRTAIDWEPFELSMVPIPADAGAQTRGEKPAETNPCEIVTRGSKETNVNEGTQSEAIVLPDPLAPPPAPPVPPEPTDADRAVTVERERAEGILEAVRNARLPHDLATRWIKEGVTLLDARGRALEEMDKRYGTMNGPAPGPQRVSVVGDDPLIVVRAGMENALMNRVAPPWEVRLPSGETRKGGVELTDQGRQYRGMNFMRIAEVLLMARGVKTHSMGPMELITLALGPEGLIQRQGYHTTSDFSLLLADVANKSLRASYGEAPQTFAPITRRVTLADFKLSNRLQIGDSPALLEVGEHGEFQAGTITEGKEAMQLKTYGRKFAITRQALINDDTDAFSRVAAGFGRQARALESDLAWAQITSNPVMGDGVTLFHANHGNLAGAGAAIDITTLSAGVAAMGIQKGIDTTSFLNLSAQNLIVPVARRTVALQFTTQITPALGGSVNPFAGAFGVIAEPRLDANSTTAWYLAAGTDQIDVLELATLEGAAGPMTESRVGFDVDGLEIKVRHDVVAKVIDWRGIYKNPGA
jgi:hypothetical protein